MNQDQQHMNLVDTLWKAMYKYGMWIAWVILGLIGMFSADLLRNRKFTIWYILGCTGAAIFVGYIVGIWVFANYPAEAPIYIPIATLLSNNIMSAIIAIDYKALLEKDWKGAFEILFRNKK